MNFFCSDWCGTWVLSNSSLFFVFSFLLVMLLISIESALSNISYIWHQLKKFEVKEFFHLVIYSFLQEWLFFGTLGLLLCLYFVWVLSLCFDRLSNWEKFNLGSSFVGFCLDMSLGSWD